MPSCVVSGSRGPEKVNVVVTRSNNPRLFAETVTLDAWRSSFDDKKGEASLHIDVVFAHGGRVGGGSAPIRFRLTLRRAEVHIVRDAGGVIDINRSSVFRSKPLVPKGYTVTKTKSRVGGGLSGGLSGSSVNLSANAQAGKMTEVTKRLDDFETTILEVVHWKTERGYAFIISTRSDKGLKGQPWDATEPLMKIRDTNPNRKRGEPPEVRIEIHCLREDLIIEDIEFTSSKFPLWRSLSRQKQIAVEQYIKEELTRSGLPCGDLSEPFSRIVVGDATPVPE